MHLHEIPHLHAGDRVAIIAPASRCSDDVLSQLRLLLTSWDLQAHIFEPIFGDDLLCANSDPMRFRHLHEALLGPDIRGVICARGGYGSMRLLPLLCSVTQPLAPKVFLGMSDITALHLFLQQQWHWPTVHAGLTRDKLTAESILAVKALLFGDMSEIIYPLYPMNQAAHQTTVLESTMIGGNLTLIQASIGTSWHIKAKNKIMFIEEIAERGYRIDRMLEHLRQASVFSHVDAIVFGDCLEGEEPDGSSLVDQVLARFAEQTTIPVLRIRGLGHGPVNYPLPLGTKTVLRLGKNAQVVF